MTNVDLSEKIVKLRKNNNLTQEQLAEQLNVSRQSVSKWESGQAAPDIDKIVAMGEIFHVTTDYLLKPSELDELAMKTEMLEKRQREILENEEKSKEKQYCICVCASIYIIAFAVFMLIRQVSWINDVLWNIFPGRYAADHFTAHCHRGGNSCLCQAEAKGRAAGIIIGSQCGRRFGRDYGSCCEES